MATKNKKYKEPNKAKSAITQYCVVGLICLPVLLVLAFWFTSIKLNAAVSILIYCVIILFAWTVWIMIRRQLEKRAEKIRAMRKVNEQRMQKAMLSENKRARDELRQMKNSKGKVKTKVTTMDKPFDFKAYDENQSGEINVIPNSDSKKNDSFTNNAKTEVNVITNSNSATADVKQNESAEKNKNTNTVDNVKQNESAAESINKTTEKSADLSGSIEKITNKNETDNNQDSKKEKLPKNVITFDKKKGGKK